MSKRLFSREQDKLLATAYMAGVSSTRLARQHGCDKSAVLGALRREGVLLRASGKARSSEIDVRRAEILDLYASGLSLWAIKRRLGCHSHPIRRILREAGVRIERRPVVGQRHHMWSGGVCVDSGGYRKIRLAATDPYAPMRDHSGYAMEHRVVMARALGRLLHKTESVHHIDGNRQNNALSNLQLRHGKHGHGVAMRCRVCGSHAVEAVQLAGGAVKIGSTS